MLIDIKFDFPEFKQLEELVDDATGSHHDHEVTFHISRECHGFIDCAGQLWDYLGSCFH